MDEQTLEPCPFCGNDEPVLDRIVLSRLSAVFCNSCEIAGERKSTPEAAIEAWNHRAAHSVIAGKVAELTEALERIANARTAMDGGSIAECRRTAAAALATYPERRHD